MMCYSHSVVMAMVLCFLSHGLINIYSMHPVVRQHYLVILALLFSVRFIKE